jgi:hypothetical protein
MGGYGFLNQTDDNSTKVTIRRACVTNPGINRSRSYGKLDTWDVASGSGGGAFDS